MKHIIKESQESKSQSNAIKYLQQKLGWDYDRANRFVRYELRMAIPSLRDKNLAKFTLGVTRMFMEEQLNDISKQRDLNETLRFLSAHLDEYDRNLNGISANDLIQRFAQIRKDNLEQEKNDINNMSFGETDYEIVRIDSFEDAKQYYDYTNPNGRWCLTYMKDMFDRYSNNGMNQIYFCLKNGFENVPCEVGANAPLDDYGLSMLSIIVNENGELAYCTTRWNHDYGGSDSSMSAKEVSEVVGVNFYEVFKPNGKWNELLQSVHERLQNGESPSNIFDYVGSFSEGCAVVELNHKWNFITTKGKLIIEQWFDYAYSFREGCAIVKLNRKFNFITTEGQFLSKQWFDDASVFIEGFARVKLNGKWNFITTEGQFLSKQWFDVIWNFREGFSEVKLNDNYYYIDKKGQLYDKKPNLSESIKRIYMNENQLSLLNESQESKSQSQAVKYLQQKLGWDYDKAFKFVRNDLRNDITSLRDKNIAKFTLGVTRMFADGELNNARTISKLNSTLKLMSAHLDEYDRNLNDISCNELISRFEKNRNDNIEKEKNEINSMSFGDSDYEIVPINSFEDAKQYYKYTYKGSPWCLTYMDDMYESYTCNGINQIYFCLKHGFENIEPVIGENTPLDEYGLSMISVIVNENGELTYCTTRWNHKNGGSDSAMTAKELSQVINVNFFSAFKHNNKWYELLYDVKQKLSKGLPLDEIFDDVEDFYNGFAVVELNGKYNFINVNGEFISEQWFDYAYTFSNGFAVVRLNGKYNFINVNCEFISEQWFDDADNFSDGCAKIELNNKCNFINVNGEFISEQWFEVASNFFNSIAFVGLNYKYNFINVNGEIFSEEWFDYIDKFSDGFAKVSLNGKYNFINVNGEFISKQWFDYAYRFSNGFAKVRLNDNDVFLDIKGNLYDSIPRISESVKRIYITENQLSLLNEYYSCPDKVYIDGSYINYQSFDAYPFGIIKRKFVVGDRCGTHASMIIYPSLKAIGFYSIEDYKDELSSLDYDEAFDLELQYDNAFDYYYEELRNDINGRIWIEKEVISFWNKTLSRVDVIYSVSELQNYFNKSFDNLRIVIDGKIMDYNDYLNSNSDITQDSSKTSNALNIHLANQKDKRNALSDFRKNRDEKNGKKLGNMTMAQYHNLKTIGDDIDSKGTNLSENLELEVEPSDVDLSSFEKQNDLNPHLWEGDELNSTVRLKLLKIAKDFYKTLNVKWMNPSDIILCGSMCNYNWSEYSDIDVHILIDFREISENIDILQDYLNIKKNEWNNEHNELNIHGYKVELYVQDINDEESLTSNGVYSLIDNRWINVPSRNKVTDLSEKRQQKISKVVADIMTQIDDFYVNFETFEKDNVKLYKLSLKIDKLLSNLKNIRKNGLDKNGELSLGNIVYKAIRRANYFDKLWDLKVKIYDKINSID